MKGALSFLLLFVLACGSEESGTSKNATRTVAASEETSAAGPIDFTDADLDAYARGIAKEIELVKAARARGDAQAEWEDQTIPAAAQATGIADDRYRHTRKAVHTVLETLDFQGKIDGPLEIDLTRVDDATKARLAKDPFDALSPAAAAALRSRMESLLPLWTEYMSLTALFG